MHRRNFSITIRSMRRLSSLFPLLLIADLLLGCDHKQTSATPAVDNHPIAAVALISKPVSPSSIPDGMVLLPGGDFLMGSDHGIPAEAPQHRVNLQPFYIDRYDVTVEQFQKFVETTGYKTDNQHLGFGAVFSFARAQWEKADGVTWKNPEQPGVPANPREPVVQVSWNDATAYARWAGKRLPTEAEFEYAARGGLVGKEYSWGDVLRPGGKPVANWWQGEFPTHNTGEDGYLGRSPVGAFPANGFGLYDMAGNVWQWCGDWYTENYFAASPAGSPTGPPSGTERVIRGGSFLCAENFCQNYRAAGRSHNTPDSATDNIGFRCVCDMARK
jgi:formylglycine-generating enzyme required for sulfatase activity